jgi:GH24 family phage-related lysozyme (muramidase)
MTKAEAEQRLTKEVNKRLVAIRNKIPDFDTFPADAQVAMLSSWYRGSLSGSSKTIKLINKGSYAAAATEFLNNEEYKNAVARGRPGIRPRMEKTADAIRSLRQPEELEI